MKTQSLHGLRVLNTRPREQAAALSQLIQEAGGVSIELPTIEIVSTSDWLHCLPDLNSINQAIFISANAVEQCFIPLQQQQIEWPSSIEVIAIGKGSAAALKQFNIPVHTIPEVSNSEHLLMLPSLKEVQNQNILLFKGEGGRALIEEILLERGANLFAFDVYRRTLAKINYQFIRSIWRDDLVDIILLTSEQSMHNLFQLFEEKSHHWLRSKTCLVLSERLAQTASLLGIKHIICSRPDEIMNALFDYVTKD